MDSINDLTQELKVVTANYAAMISKQDAKSVEAGLKLKQLKGDLQRQIEELENPDKSKALETPGKEIVYKIFGIPIFSKKVYIDEEAFYQRMQHKFESVMIRQLDIQKNKNKNIQQ